MDRFWKFEMQSYLFIYCPKSNSTEAINSISFGEIYSSGESSCSPAQASPPEIY